MDLPLEKITCSEGLPYLDAAVEAANLMSVPVEILLGQIKQESRFQNLKLSDDNGNSSVGIGQVNETEWLQAGQEPEIAAAGLAGVYRDCTFFKGPDACLKDWKRRRALARGKRRRAAVRRRVSAGDLALEPRYNMLALAAALRREHARMLQEPEAARDGFGPGLASWLAACAAYNGGPKIWTVIYDRQGKSRRRVDWPGLSAARLLKLIRTGNGIGDTEFYRQSVARHVGMIAVWLNQPGIFFCQLDDRNRRVKTKQCTISAEERLRSIAVAGGESPACFE